MVRFFDFFNTPIAVLAVLVVVVGVNAFLYLGPRPSEAPNTAPAERGGSRTTVERTERRGGAGEATRPATTLLSTPSTKPSATVSATASATSSP
jgi:hypothetical protein